MVCGMIIQHESDFEHTWTSVELTIHTASHKFQPVTRTCPEIREHFKESLPHFGKGLLNQNFRQYFAYIYLSTGRSHSIFKEPLGDGMTRNEGVADAGG